MKFLSKDQREHRVYHYYYTGWPDFSVVDRDKLLDLIETIDDHGYTSATKKREDLLKPIVVHCR
jgi:protein tyrosine phosphatase